MIRAAHDPDLDAVSGREIAGWVAAGATVLALHAGVAAWATRDRPVAPAEAAAAAAVMIELAPEPAAPEAVEDHISEALRQAPPSDTPELKLPTPKQLNEVADLPDPVVEPEPETTPPETAMTETATVPEPVVEPVEETIETEIATAEVLLPRKRAEIQTVTEEAPEKPAEKTPKPQKKTAQPPAAAPAKVQAKAAPVAAASETNTGSSQSASPAKWQARLMAHLERRKRYPAAARKRGDEGVAWVRFAVDASGNVKSVSLAKSSGIPALDVEVVAMVRRASPVPQPPPDFRRELTVPVNFNIR